MRRLKYNDLGFDLTSLLDSANQVASTVKTIQAKPAKPAAAVAPQVIRVEMPAQQATAAQPAKKSVLPYVAAGAGVLGLVALFAFGRRRRR